MIGQTISHYKITKKLGEGGMGVVYKALDTKLDRPVALKFLPPELTRDPDAKRRFVHEAKAASALQHNNICTIHEIDETEDGHLFIAMDCYEGETLKQKVARGPLPLDESIEIVSQVAEGLGKAHEGGMVHRDIKLANIMITRDGVVKIVDFGLAKLAGQTKVTKTGTTVGTVAYMSPEQASGKDVDHRSDVFSLGTVLYEMLSGELPFKGDHEAAVLYGITHSYPEPLAKYRTDVPEDLQRIVETMLHKEPDARYQNASEIAADLARFRKGVSTTGYAGDRARSIRRRSLTIAAISILAVIAGYFVYSRFLSPMPEEADTARKMIAVLPFDNLGPPQDEYFADGITDAITARLAAIHELGVISRQSAIQYKNTNKSLRDIGGELGVEYVLEGTVQRERPTDPASRIRVIPQLIRVSDDTHLWAETYDDEMTEVFQVQSEIAGEVAQALDVMLLASERQAMATKPTDNLEAYEYYLRGKDHDSRNLNISDARAAVETYRKAVEIDPKFSIAWANLARAHIWLYWHYGMRDEIAQAVDAVDNASRLSPESNETHMALGYINYLGHRDYDNALKHFLEVLKGQPSNSDALSAKGFIHRRKGEWQEAVTDLKQTMELDPRNYSVAVNLVGSLIYMRNFSEADHFVNRAISLNPSSSSFPYEYKALVNMMKDETSSGAQSTIRQALQKVTAGGWEATNWSIRLILIRGMPELYEEVLSKAPYEGPPILRAEGLLYRAELDLQRGKTSSAMARCDSIRTLLEPIAEVSSDDVYAHCLLGLTYSRMDLKDKAIKEGRTITKLLPISKDAYAGAGLLRFLAEIYVRAGEYEEALDQIEYLATIPSLISVGLLNRDPIWEPLRDQPRYRRLVERLSQIDS